jgi:hypothetical protein
LACFLWFLTLLAQIELSRNVLLDIGSYLHKLKMTQDYLICGSEVTAYMNELSSIRLIGHSDTWIAEEPRCADRINIRIHYQDEGVVQKPFPNYVLARGLF